MSAAKVTHAQKWALRQIAMGEFTYIHHLDSRVRVGLEARGILVWNQQLGTWFGRIDRNATLANANRAGVPL